MARVRCKMCGLSCMTPDSIVNHVIGKKHMTQLALVSPGTVEELGRLQYFIDTYMEDFPVLGLEYVLETQVGSFYHYSCKLRTCELSNKELDWHQMVYHVTNPIHIRGYIECHHPSLLPSENSCKQMKVQEIKMLKRCAYDIHVKYGRKKVCTQAADICQPPQPQICCLPVPPLEVSRLKRQNAFHHCSLCGADSISFIALSKHVMSAQHRQHVKERQNGASTQRIQANHCSLCAVTCSSIVALSDHVVNDQHRMNMGLSTDVEHQKVGSLGHFLDTYMLEEPILGLEYIDEIRLSSLYKYNCQLCKESGTMQFMVAHLTDVDHLNRYLCKHHSDMFKSVPKGLERTEFLRVLKDLAVDVLDHEWHKVYVAPVAGNGNLSEDSEGQRGNLLLSRQDNESSCQSQWSHDRYGDSLTLTLPGVDRPPLAKRKRLLPKQYLKALPSTVHAYKDPHYNESHAVELQVTSALQELEFHNNQQFFEYLANFKIKDYHDAILIQKITLNCIKALTRFQKEEKEQERLMANHEREASVAHTSRDDQEILDTSVKPEPPPLALETITPKDTVDPPSEQPKKEATKDFLSCLKQMNEFEVVSFFQKIATSNPEFQGIDIPAIIRYLKATGKLKTP